MEDHRRAAEHFITEETQFHLGMLPTEQSHPKTRGLAETVQEDTAAGVRMLQSVDRDVADLAGRVFGSTEMGALAEAITDAIAAGHRVCFSGCGSTGRLSILLEGMWRRFWHGVGELYPEHAARATALADRVVSIMTGGDYALIRSVEGFEDYISFGRRQVVELGLGEGDVLVAISEGGETSSVIGTLMEAGDRGLGRFFVFNNPADVLAEHVERSRRVIEDPSITILELASGPMGVAGSTRMQATTAELLVVGAALEQALLTILPEVLPADVVDELAAQWAKPMDGAAQFEALLDDLERPATVDAMAAWVEIEHDLYAEGGLITYYGGECLLDIFTDTTERAPTFMIPPFRRRDDEVSPPSWAFVKDPLRPTPEAWLNVLQREPRCLDWDRDLYEALGASPGILANPPALSREDLMAFQIGCEPAPSRTEAQPNAAMQVLLADDAVDPEGEAWQLAWSEAAEPYARRLAVVIGGDAETGEVERTLTVSCRLQASPLGLWRRLATKLVLNTVSTATMGPAGRLVSNWMAHVECSNKKLIDRGTRLVAELAGLDYETACHELHRTIAQQRTTQRPGEVAVSPVTATLRRLEATDTR